MNIVGYCRVSTDKEDQLHSLETQKHFFEEYAKKHGHTLVRLYADEGISGTKIRNRKEFQRLMLDSEQKLFEMVVVKDISRFARNTVDLLNSTRQLKALNIETLFLTANMSVLGNSEFVLTIFGALAQEESANTSKRIKFSKERNAEKGRVPCLAYGYDKIPGDYFNMTINKQEAEIIHRIYDLYTNQGYGGAKIAQMLNAEGQRTKRGSNWTQAGVAGILRNELYTGKIINGKQEIADFLTGVRINKDKSEWKIVQRPDLRIIEPEFFKKTRKMAEERTQMLAMSGRQSNKHLFSTLIKCTDCGCTFRRMVQHYKNTYIRWVCSGRNAKGADTCPNKTVIDEMELIQSLQTYFEGMFENKDDIVRQVKAEFLRIYQSKDDSINQEAQLMDKLSKLQKTRQKWMNMYDDDLISREELKSKMSQVNKEVEKAEGELKIVNYNLGKSDQLEELLHRTFQIANDAISVDSLTNAQLKQIVQKIEVDHSGNCDVYLRLFGELGLGETYLINKDTMYG